MDEVRQNLANFEDAAGPVGNLIMARHSGLYIFCFWFFSPLGHIAAFYCFLSFLASEIWKWSPDASGNKALGLWIICSIFFFHLLLASQRLWGLWGWVCIDCRELGEAGDRPSICCHQQNNKTKQHKNPNNKNRKEKFKGACLR